MPWPTHFNYSERRNIDNARGKPVSTGKAKEILRHGTIHGQPLTAKQKGLFGLIAGGGRPSKKKGFKG